MDKSHIIYGLRPIIEVINSNQSINKVFLQKGLGGELFKELEMSIRKNGISVSYVPIERLNRFTKNNHQGAVAEISPVQFPDFEVLIEQIINTSKPPLLLLLDKVSDVRNFGAILRTAECSGVDAVIIPKSGAAPITDDTIKTSAGAAFNIPITKVDHLKDAIYYLQASGIKVVAATEKAKNDIYNIEFNGPSAIVMGSEGKGISSSILNMVDDKAKLPLLGDIGSLNVSVACGVFLYEVVRQRMK